MVFANLVHQHIPDVLIMDVLIIAKCEILPQSTDECNRKDDNCDGNIDVSCN